VAVAVVAEVLSHSVVVLAVLVVIEQVQIF
jgi:hypothetical protein